MSRKNIVAGNWKMNKTFSEAEELLEEILELFDDYPPSCDVVLCPPALYLELATDYMGTSPIMIGAQNVNENDKGAYTGELSAAMLKSVEVDYCIIGHSERRKYFKESNELLAMKIDSLLARELKPIYCCGELKQERESGELFNVVKEQIEKALFHLSPEQFKEIVIAYEPVWAIGTGLTATPEQAQGMHAYIRQLITEKYGEEIAQSLTILYGGSCNAENAASLFINPDVDGGLIGGASLKSKDFMKIAHSFPA